MTIALAPDNLVGTDIAQAFLLVGTAALAHLLFMQDVDMALVGKLMAGSIPGVLLGSRIAPRVPRRPLRSVLAILLMSTAISMLK